MPVTHPGAFTEYAGLPATPGKTLTQMMVSANKGEMGALLVAGADPVKDFGMDETALKKAFVIVAGYLSHRDGRAG